MILLLIVSITVVTVHNSKASDNLIDVEAFTEKQIHFCPSTTSQIQTTKGSTDCCEGEAMNGKCSGKTVCTLSPSHDGVPNCSEYWAQYFKKQSIKFCPKNAPFYSEDISSSKSKVKGCSSTKSGNINCKIYDSLNENKTRADSCYVSKEKEKIKCPNGGSPIIKSNKDGVFQYYYCIIDSQVGLQSICAEDISYKTFLDKTNPNWQTSTSVSNIKKQFCSRLSEQTLEEENNLQKQVALEQTKRKQAEKQLAEMTTQMMRFKQEWSSAIRPAKM